MNPKPRVTVGLPVYNGQKYLEQAIDSILAQTYGDFELLISDNGSTDRTEAICRAYAARDPRVRYLRYEQNRGAAWNFNNCVHMAESEYFKWQCYDDLLEPTMLEACVPVLDAEPEVVLAYPRTRIVDDVGETIGLWGDNFEHHSPHAHERLRHYFRNKSRNEGQYGVWRRSELLKSGLMGAFPLSDQVLMAEMMMRGPFRELPEYLFLKRFHPGISTEAYNQYQMAAFMDPRKRDAFTLVRYDRLLAFASAVRRCKLPPMEALRCYLQLVLMVLMPANWLRMAQDLAVASRAVLKRRVKSPR
jgi:glycosyltransferase involved in cell wall biosynthesis